MMKTQEFDETYKKFVLLMARLECHMEQFENYDYKMVKIVHDMEGYFTKKEERHSRNRAILSARLSGETYKKIGKSFYLSSTRAREICIKFTR